MALSQTAVRRWFLVHKWTSLVSTAFLLMFCLTGLPLIFHEEIEELTRPAQIAQQVAAKRVDLDALTARAVAGKPGWKVLYLTWDRDKPLIYVTTAPRYDASEEEMAFGLFDARSGEPVSAPPLDEGVMHVLLELHAELLMGLPGQLFLGLVGVVFLVALVSGTVVYVPFMRKLDFATVRKDRSARVKWLDTHNMVGIVSLGWVAVVGLTGVVVTMSTPITAIWQHDQLARYAPSHGDAPLPGRLASIDRAVSEVRTAAPDTRVSFIAWPGTEYSTGHHYMIALAGNTPLTGRLIDPAMVDAATGRLVAVDTMPWYVKMLYLSAPLHFGDYGGMMLKIIWALLDIATIVVLGTGLYLWLGKRRVPADRRLAEMARRRAARQGQSQSQSQPEPAE